MEGGGGGVPEPLGPELELHQEIIRIHDGVHGVVHGDEVQAGVASRVRKPGVEEDGHVVVPLGEGGREGGREEGLVKRNKHTSVYIRKKLL